ncbi:MAG: amidohydrolase family protein [Bacillota bacterium]
MLDGTLVVDSHVHVWTPDFIDHLDRYFSLSSTREFLSHRVLANVAAMNGGRVPFTEEYLARMGDHGIDGAVVFGFADTVDGCRRSNEDVAALCERHNGRLHGLASVPLPDTDAAAVELRRAVRDQHLKGVKIYPSLSGLRMGAPQVRAVLEEAAALGVPVITDSSFICWPGGGNDPGSANVLVELLATSWFRALDGARLVAAHLGGGLVFFRDLLLMFDPGMAEALERVWFDLSPTFPESMVRAALQVVPPSRLLFGSDFPFTDGGPNLATLAALDLPPADKAAILGGNVLRLLGVGPAAAGEA